MYCPKCEKDLSADATFCPYCGNEKLIEKVEPTPEAEPETVEVEATEAEAVETEAPVAEAPVAEATEPASAPAGKPKNGKGAVIAVLCVLAVLAAIAAAFAVGYMVSREAADQPDETVTTTDAPVTTAPATDAELFPDDYTATYPDGFSYADTDISQYVTLGKYKGLTATITTSSEVTDAEVKAYIEQLLAQYSTTQAVTGRPAAMGDSVVIDFVGTMDGVAFDGGTASDQSLTLGEGGYIDGFEDGIVGMNIGETKTIDVTFPESYHKTDLAGKPAQFAITLDSIEESVLPEYNDAFVREKFEYDTIPEFENDVKAMLVEERAYDVLAEKQEAVYGIAVDNATVKGYPEGLVEDYMKTQIDYVKSYAEIYNMSYGDLTEQVLGMSAAAYEAEVRTSAEEAIKQEMVVYAIAQAENITAPEEELRKAQDYYLEYYGVETVAEMCEMLGVTETYFANTINFSVVYAEVMDFLVENATFNGAK